MKHTSKKILIVFSLLIAVLLISSCSKSGGSSTSTSSTSSSTSSSSASSASSASSSSEKTVLRIAWWGSQTRHNATNKVIEMYEELHPEIDIQAEFYDFDGYFTKLDTLVAADDVWDIFQLGGNWPKYLPSIEPLNQYVENGSLDVSDTTEAFLATTTDSDGTLTGISIGTNTYGIAYDPAMFEAAGVPLPRDNWTWDEWKDAALKIHEELGIYGSSSMNNYIAGVSMRVSQTEKDANFYKSTNDGLGWSDPQPIADYLQMIKDLTDAGAYPDPGAINEIRDVEGDYIVTEEAAMTWVASNQIASIVNACGRDIKIAMVPKIEEDGPYGMIVQSSQQFSVSSHSKHKEEAIAFLDYFVNNIDANLVLNGERGVPIMSKVRDAVVENASDVDMMIYDFVEKIGSLPLEACNVISPEPKTEIEDYYDLLVERVQYGVITPEDAATELLAFAESKF